MEPDRNTSNLPPILYKDAAFYGTRMREPNRADRRIIIMTFIRSQKMNSRAIGFPVLCSLDYK